MIISCVLYYLFLYAQTYRKDELTGLLNHRSFLLDSQKESQSDLTVVSKDMNGLKEINDTKGHQAGDAASYAISETLISATGKNFRVYRTGGDEFSALENGKSEECVQQFINDAKSALNETGHMVLFGYAFYHAGDNFDAICNQADALMYKDNSHYRHRERKD